VLLQQLDLSLDFSLAHVVVGRCITSGGHWKLRMVRSSTQGYADGSAMGGAGTALAFGLRMVRSSTQGYADGSAMGGAGTALAFGPSFW
jgi:hypothetical protein